MFSNHKIGISIGATFTWIGFVGAISFMEAWLKFQVSGMTLKLGLAIGQMVFGALNKVEVILASVLIICFVFNKNIGQRKWVLLCLPVGILLLQSLWLLPALNDRVESILNNSYPVKSDMHLYYVLMEIIKVISLVALGVNLLKNGKYEIK